LERRLGERSAGSSRGASWREMKLANAEANAPAHTKRPLSYQQQRKRPVRPSPPSSLAAGLASEQQQFKKVNPAKAGLSRGDKEE